MPYHGLRLGMIGASAGNGHPWSWSAIVNGYDPAAMAACPYPAIPAYLGQRHFPQDQIQGACVSHLWTQDGALSAAIARATRISVVVERIEDMIGAVDAVIVARDDIASRRPLLLPLLDAGMPIFVDKLLAATVDEARMLLDRRRYPAQLVCGSALRHLPLLQPDAGTLLRLGGLSAVDACVFHDWQHYAVHVVEPVLALVGDHGDPVSATPFGSGMARGLAVEWADGLLTSFLATGSAETPLRLRLFGRAATVELGGSDNFTAFKRTIEHFMSVVQGHTVPPSDSFVLKVVDLVQRGSGTP